MSNEDVDDITTIKYKNHEQTDLICAQAKLKLNRLSSSGLKIEQVEVDAREVEKEEANLQTELNIENCGADSAEDDVLNEIEANPADRNEAKNIIKKPAKKLVKKRVSCPPKFVLNNECIDENKLFPSLAHIIHEHTPPPTYSDSESFYTTVNSSNQRVNSLCSPSAPAYNLVESSSEISLTRVTSIVDGSSSDSNCKTPMKAC